MGASWAQGGAFSVAEGVRVAAGAAGRGGRRRVGRPVGVGLMGWVGQGPRPAAVLGHDRVGVWVFVWVPGCECLQGGR